MFLFINKALGRNGEEQKEKPKTMKGKGYMRNLVLLH